MAMTSTVSVASRDQAHPPALSHGVPAQARLDNAVLAVSVRL